MQRLVASPCSLPQMPRAAFLDAVSNLGFAKVEAFTSWAAAHLDPTQPARGYRDEAAARAIRYSSLHLPPVTMDDVASVDRAIAAARFAADLGADVVLYKAATREAYIRYAPRFLDGLVGVGVIPVLQNHFGTAVSSFADVREVMDGVGDPRLRLLLEVGHYHKGGESWEPACERYGERIALVHVKDMRGPTPVPFGSGEVDFMALLRRLEQLDYHGDIVVEIETEADAAERLRQMGQACDHLYHCGLKD